MVIDTDVVKAQVKTWVHRFTLIVIGAAAGLSATVSDKTQDYLEATKELPAIVEEQLDVAQDVLVNTQKKADQAVTKVGKTVVSAGKKVDAAAKKVSKKIQDKLKPLDELGAKIGKPPLPQPKPSAERKPAGNWQHSPR